MYKRYSSTKLISAFSFGFKFFSCCNQPKDFDDQKSFWKPFNIEMGVGFIVVES
jgi:hypothetical protein